MKLKQIIFLIIGCLSLALGCVGIVLPILPTVPFLPADGFCFANSSQKLHDWFIGTQMYKKHLESFVQKKGMTVRAKATILTSGHGADGRGLCPDAAQGNHRPVRRPRRGVGLPSGVLALRREDHPRGRDGSGKLNFAKSSCACYNGFVIRMQRRIFL